MNRLTFEFWMIMAVTTDFLSELTKWAGWESASRFWDRVFWKIFWKIGKSLGES